MKGNKILWLVVLVCLGINVYSFRTISEMQAEIEQLKKNSQAVSVENDIFNEALKIIQGKSGASTQPVKKKGLVDKAKSAAQAKALDMVANKVKKSVQEKAEANGADATAAVKGVDMIFGMLQKAMDANDGTATEANFVDDSEPEESEE